MRYAQLATFALAPLTRQPPSQAYTSQRLVRLAGASCAIPHTGHTPGKFALGGVGANCEAGCGVGGRESNIAVCEQTHGNTPPFISIVKYAPALLLLCLCSLFSCARISPRLLVLEGNFMSARQRYSEAMVSYNRALAGEDVSPYAEAGLASVYYSLDENKAALERLEDSQKLLAALPTTGHRELRYRNSFNKGVILFSGGDFPAAALAFRQALSIDPARLEAKRNLELSLLSVAGEKARTGGIEETPGETAGRTALFEYFRQKEQSQWKSREWAAEEENAGPDY